MHFLLSLKLTIISGEEEDEGEEEEEKKEDTLAMPLLSSEWKKKQTNNLPNKLAMQFYQESSTKTKGEIKC